MPGTGTPPRAATPGRVRRLICVCLALAGVLMIATASLWGPAAVALFDGEGILPQFGTSVPFWPLMPIALAAWLWTAPSA